MSTYEHVTEFAGLQVTDFTSATQAGSLPAAGSTAWRVWVDDFVEEFDPFQELFARFLATVDTTQVTALIIGNYGACHEVNASEPRDLLVAAAARFPNLRALFFGEVLQMESEISWIEQCDVTPLFTAFPGLETVVIRGGSGLVLEPPNSRVLRELRLEAGGLPAGVVRAVAAGDLPALVRLELWLGVSEYGGDATVADLAPILRGDRLPALRHLGLEDSEIQDELCSAVASAPVVARLESLSLAMGVLTDEGAEALLSGQPLSHLTELDLHHHFLTDAMAERVRAALPGITVNLDEQGKSDDEWRYVAVAE
ncbi:MAG: STM4015 family protein [Streptosporangiaceae bacterium]